ncbi:MAG TPA: succinate dehydrogenase, hydrophobic membrane anchor protein [Gammaproteobacteria bacterium]|nr:succinate dehydrogenase, hydrophobic membrane anchor protein [Gammaproteobacteria bacterium]
MSDLRNPLARARGLGSAKEGTVHWVAQRVSALALIPLTLWFVYSMLIVMHGSYEQAYLWMHAPLVAVLLVILIGTVFYHAYLGLQVVIEDYVHGGWSKHGALLIIKFLCVLLALSGIFAVLRIAFGG